jgi:L-cysteine/cystine lyase
MALRDEFPVLRETAYLGAGTCGPTPAASVAAARAELEREQLTGRGRSHFERMLELRVSLRAAYAGALGCAAEDVALTSCTTDGLASVLGGLSFSPGDEILTSDEEHPGLLGALQAARDLHGAEIRFAPLGAIADAVGERTRAVACSHVGWQSGTLVSPGLGDIEVPVILDGAQGVGAVETDVLALGCDAYAGAGQKWLCGPEGTGMLYVSAELRARVAVTRRAYLNFEDAGAGLDAALHPGAARFDAPAIPCSLLASALAATTLVLDAAPFERAAALAALLASQLAEAGHEVLPRGATTLVSWRSADAEAARDRLAAAGVVLRDIPGLSCLRASVGAWNDERDVERLLAALT